MCIKILKTLVLCDDLLSSKDCYDRTKRLIKSIFLIKQIEIKSDYHTRMISVPTDEVNIEYIKKNKKFLNTRLLELITLVEESEEYHKKIIKIFLNNIKEFVNNPNIPPKIDYSFLSQYLAEKVEDNIIERSKLIKSRIEYTESKMTRFIERCKNLEGFRCFNIYNHFQYLEKKIKEHEENDKLLKGLQNLKNLLDKNNLEEAKNNYKKRSFININDWYPPIEKFENLIELARTGQVPIMSGGEVVHSL